MKKTNNKKGFTLAELLVVVAIIGVLVAISIPIFTQKLDKAKQATDEANVRSAKAAAVNAYLTDDVEGNEMAVYVYDAKNGQAIKVEDSGDKNEEVDLDEIKIEAEKIEGYNQAAQGDAGAIFAETGVIKVTIGGKDDAHDTVETEWVAGKTKKAN